VPRLLCLVFAFSGAAGLAFETLWFHQAAIAFGSSVWASSLVLAAFMSGLACGSAIAARVGDRLANPARSYAALELLIAASGVWLVRALPAVGESLAPALAKFLDRAWVIQPLRFALAFGLLLLPSSAMGATLPLLTRALRGHAASTGSALGRLYGWNTLGAVAGSLGVALFCIESFGIRGSGLVAAALGGAAAIGALLCARRSAGSRTAPPSTPLTTGVFALARRAPGPALAAFGCGFALLACEVIWFRLLAIAVIGTEVAFALMLAVVLTGIALGGLAAGALLRRAPGCERELSPLLLCAGALLVLCYASGSAGVWALGGERTDAALTTLGLAALMSFPVALLSGCAFPFTGALLAQGETGPARATGALTTLNTLGAGLGSLAGGFALLPALGSEAALLALAALYGALGLIVAPRSPSRVRPLAAGVALAVALALFPHGTLQRTFLTARSWRHAVDSVETLGYFESSTETLVVYEERIFGQSYAHVLVTNGHVMSSSRFAARRYMKLYAWLPEALHPRLERALLISFGVGSTARALLDSPELAQLDVVDISREILGLSELVHGRERDPLRDPRVAVHVEDGRYFLATTRERYDLITAEPPPPTLAGVQNLYTQEYFEHMRERLAPGGFASYWLPLHSLSETATRAILAAFCNAFEDCSLWSGWGFDLMLLGSRDAIRPVDPARFARAFGDATRSAELRELGFEAPSQLLATFVADAPVLRTLTAETPPLIDDFPHRIQGAVPSPLDPPRFYAELVHPESAAQRFASSPWIARLLPETLLRDALRDFGAQLLIDQIASFGPRALPEAITRELLHDTGLSVPILWAWGSDARRQTLLAASNPRVQERPHALQHAAVAALAARDPERMRSAIDSLIAPGAPELDPGGARLALYLLAEQGDLDAALEFAQRHPAALDSGPLASARAAFYRATYGVALILAD
jgi:predicted membrane-bound spermidine synthase